MKITVLCGGFSPERNVSMISGQMIANALRENGHSVACADLYLGVSDPSAAFTVQKEPTLDIDNTIPDLSKLETKGNGSLIGDNILELCKSSDITFLALHGGIGEDGRLQAFLDCHGITYTGASHIGSTLAIDKSISKLLFKECGIPVPRGITVKQDTSLSSIKKSVPFPCVIKPCSCGSSVGISFAKNDRELENALSRAFIHDSTLLIEEKLVGRELTVGILDGHTLPAVEIIPKSGFYDYENKYIKGRTVELCPAPITEATAGLLSETALTAAKALRIDSYCRVDFILSDGVPYCLEINTLPGMTKTSLLPQEAEAAGISYAELCERIAISALRKRNKRQKIVGKKVEI